MPVTAGCLCGAVRLTVSGAPDRVAVCHCLDCRKHHGAVFHAAAIFPAAAVAVAGETASWPPPPPSAVPSAERDASSLRPMATQRGGDGRHFCPRCGSSVFARSGDEVEVHLGTMDAPDRFAPTYENWTVRRESWLPPFPRAHSWPGDRED